MKKTFELTDAEVKLTVDALGRHVLALDKLSSACMKAGQVDAAAPLYRDMRDLQSIKAYINGGDAPERDVSLSNHPRRKKEKKV